MDCMQHNRPPCPSPTPRVYSNSCLVSRWSHPIISSSFVSFSSNLQSFPASEPGQCPHPKIDFDQYQFSCSVVSNSLQLHGLQHARLPCLSPTPGVYSNSSSLSQWWRPIISSSVVPFSCCLQSFPASGSFQMCQLFTSGGQRTGASASTSVLPKNIQDLFPLGWTGWISLLSRGLSRVFTNTTVQKHKFFSTQLSL